MAEPSRIEDLRRRVQADPASIAFAQLAEEYRRAGRLADAVSTCQTGLAIHPDYASARITFGRALAQLDRLDEADAEFQRVLKVAPDNLPATRGLAETSRRRGALPQAMAYYRAALRLAPNHPDIERAIDELSVPLVESLDAQARDLAMRQVAALEQWMAALHVARSDQHA